MTNDWQPFFDPRRHKFQLDDITVAKLEAQLETLNQGRRKGKLRMSDMLSHWLLKMGKTPPNIEIVEPKPQSLEADIYGLAEDYLEIAAKENGVPKEEVIKYLLAGYEEKSTASIQPKKRQGAKAGATKSPRKNSKAPSKQPATELLGVE